jgi:cold-inducible RNA-binding protein
MSNKLYVGNLSFRETGRSRGFGFVEMADEDSANNAIAQFNGQEYDGRNIVVNEARPREDRGGGNGGGRGRGGYNGGGGGRSERW